MNSANNVTTDISEPLHLSYGKEAYHSANEVNYMWQILRNNGCSTDLDYMEQTLS